VSRKFKETLNYSSVNEDWRTETVALAMRPGDNVLCITGSGARPLALLAAEDVRVTAIDSNPAQNHLLRLLVAALRELSVEELLGFTGLCDCPADSRLERLDRLALAGPCRDYWAAHRPTVARGVLYQGRFERHFQRLSQMVRALRGRAIRRLVSFDDLAEQRVFLDTQWDTWWWRLVYRLALHRVTSRLFFGDPAYYAHAAVPVGPTIYHRMNAGLERYLARDSFMVSLLFTGRLPPHDLPPHLRAEGIAGIVPRLGNLDVVDADLIAHLADPSAPRYDRFSLSDVPSFMTGTEFSGLLEAVIARAAPGARLVLRQFLTRYDVPADVGARLVRDRALETRLAEEDRSFGYEFLIADVADAR